MKNADIIARDIELCEIGMALTKGAKRAQFAKHRRACINYIREQNKIDGLDTMNVDEIAEILSEDSSS